MLQLLDVPAPAAERRTNRRYQTTFGTVCRLDGSSRRQTNGLVWDVSTDGIGLLLAYPPDRGDILRGELATEDDSARVPVAMRVAHVRRLSTGDFFVGARFVRELSETDIEPFITPHLPSSRPPTTGAAPAHARPTDPWRNRALT